MSHIVDGKSKARWLPAASKLQTIGFGVSARNFKIAYLGATFAFPDLRPQAFWIRRSLVSAKPSQRWTLSCHDQASCPSNSFYGHRPAFRKSDLDSSLEQVISAWEIKRTIVLFERMLNGLGIIGSTITEDAEITHITHGTTSQKQRVECPQARPRGSH